MSRRAVASDALEPDAVQASAGSGAKSPRFPAGKVVVSVAGIAISVWLWLGSGYRWDVTPTELLHGRAPAGFRTWEGRYVRVRGTLDIVISGRGEVVLRDLHDPNDMVWLEADPESFGVETEPSLDELQLLAGRVVRWQPTSLAGGQDFDVDITLGRWNAHSIIAVLVGLWGAVFLFTNVALWGSRVRK